MSIFDKLGKSLGMAKGIDLEEYMNAAEMEDVDVMHEPADHYVKPVSLQQQISRLENLSRLQQRFVSDVSHELRTPLTTIRMASQVLFDARHNLDPASARSAELLIAQIERFETLLTDLLD